MPERRARRPAVVLLLWLSALVLPVLRSGGPEAGGCRGCCCSVRSATDACSMRASCGCGSGGSPVTPLLRLQSAVLVATIAVEPPASDRFVPAAGGARTRDGFSSDPDPPPRRVLQVCARQGHVSTHFS